MKAFGAIALFIGFMLATFSGLHTSAIGAISSQPDSDARLSWNEVAGLFFLIVGIFLSLYKARSKSDLRKE